MYVVLAEDVSARRAPPKTARRGLARDQHVFVYEPLVVEFVRSVFGTAIPATGLCSPSAFGARWRRYLHGFFGLDVGEASGYTPSLLRAGCASLLYQRNMPLDDIAWVLRHTEQKNLDSYVQELALARTRAGVTPASKAKCLRFAGNFDVVVAAKIHGHF